MIKPKNLANSARLLLLITYNYNYETDDLKLLSNKYIKEKLDIHYLEQNTGHNYNK